MSKQKILARNATIFTFDSPLTVTDIKGSPWVPCTPNMATSRGFVPPVDGSDSLVRVVGDIHAVAFREDTKLLPASVINDETQVRCDNIEETQGYKPGRKQRIEIKEEAAQALLQKAFTRHQIIRGWFDMGKGLLVIDSSSTSKCEKFIAQFCSCFEETPELKRWAPCFAASTFFTNWISSGEAPDGFTIDDRVTLVGIEGQSIKIIDNNAASEAKNALDVRLVAELGMTLNDSVSFVVNNNMAIKRISLLGIKEEADEQAELLEDARLDAEITLNALTVRGIVDAFGEVMRES
jgi:recombination associated protein RdgC